jgi:hypothetical protein
VANDYENFEMILSEVAKWTSKYETASDAEKIKDSLMKAIADEDIKAYEYSEMLRQFIVTQADPQKIDSYWFYITEQGLTRMQKLGEEAKRT